MPKPAFLSIEKTRAARLLLPPGICEHLDEEEAKWKEQLSENFGKALESDDPETAEYWLRSLHMYTRQKVFSLTLEELEDYLLKICKFVTTSKHYSVVTTACGVFVSLFKPRLISSSFRVEWRPFYNLLQKTAFCRSKYAPVHVPGNLIGTLVAIIRYVTHHFPETAAEEMLNEWSSFLIPSSPVFAQAHVLICLFLPIHKSSVHLWFDKFFDLWPMFKGGAWDYQWMVLYSRASMHDIDVDWECRLPFLFTLLANYLEMPTSPLEYEIPQISDYTFEGLSPFFTDFSTQNDLIPYFTFTLVNLVSSKCGAAVREYIDKLLFMLKPGFSPAQSGPESGALFVNSLVAQFYSRAKEERKSGPHRLPALTKSDIDWFTSSVMPIVLMERFVEDPRVSQLRSLVELNPDILPDILSAIARSTEYERLQLTALKTITSLAPVLPSYEPLKEFLEKLAPEVSPADVPFSMRVFDLTSLTAAYFPRQDETAELIETVVKRMFNIFESLTETDYASAREVTRGMFENVIANASDSLKQSIYSAFEESVIRLPPRAAADFAQVLVNQVSQSLLTRSLNASNPRELATLVGLCNKREIVQPRLREIADIILRVTKDGDRELFAYAPSLASKAIGVFTRTRLSRSLQKWQVPDDLESAALLLKYLNDDLEPLLLPPSKDSQRAAKVIASACKAAMRAIDLKNFKHVPFQFPPPPITLFHSQALSHTLTRTLDLLLLTIKAGQSKVLTSLFKRLSSIVAAGGNSDSVLTSEEGQLRMLKEFMPNNQVTYDQKARVIYTARLAAYSPPLTEIGSSLIKSVIDHAGHTEPRVRASAALFVQETSVVFNTDFLPLLQPAMSLITPGSTPEQVGGGYSVLVSACQLTLKPPAFKLLCDCSLAACHPIAPEVLDEPARTVRQLIRMTFELTGLGESRFTSGEYIDIRLQTASSAVALVNQGVTDRDGEEFATILVGQMINGCPRACSPMVLEFLLSKLVGEDQITRDDAILSLAGFIESLTPRAPRSSDSPYTDKLLKGSKGNRPLMLDRKTREDPKKMEVYFPGEGETKVKHFKVLAEFFRPGRIAEVLRILADQQVTHDEVYSRIHVSLLNSIIRTLGESFAAEVVTAIKGLITAKKSDHVIAAEGLSALIQATKHIHNEELNMSLLRFLTDVASGETEFSDIWYISIVLGIGNLDPARFDWLIEGLLERIPKEQGNIRESKRVSLIMDILFEFAPRVKNLAERLREVGIKPLLSAFARGFEQLRESGIRAITSYFGSQFQWEGVPEGAAELFGQVISAGDKFLIPLLTTQFSVQSAGTLLVARVCIDRLNQFLDLSLGKNEEEEREASLCLLRLSRANWLWPCSPSRGRLTIETVSGVVDKVLKQYEVSGRPWQVQNMSVLLSSAFITVNFFFLTDETLEAYINNFVMKGLSAANYDIQDSAAEVLGVILKSSQKMSDLIPSLIHKFSGPLKTGEASHTRIGAAKGFLAIVMSTLIFDSVPDYLIDCFNHLTEAMTNDPAVETTISQGLAEFWGAYEANITAEAAEALAPYRETMRPGYFS